MGPATGLPDWGQGGNASRGLVIKVVSKHNG
jgi:hypothetical protein